MPEISIFIAEPLRSLIARLINERKLIGVEIVADDLCGRVEVVRDLCLSVIDEIDRTEGKNVSPSVEFLRVTCQSLGWRVTADFEQVKH